MSTLSEIQKAAALPPEEKQQLMLFLGARLRAEGARLPEPRKFSREQIRFGAGLDGAVNVLVGTPSSSSATIRFTVAASSSAN